tara:strand:- start:9872 stop:10669 length:798 start_codon:yes stop_codon:yes gene_type:complete
MSMNLDDVQVGGTLRVGTGVCPAIKDGDEGINGAVYAEGPVVFGTQQAFPQEQATLMVARTTNNDPDCEPADRSLWVKGNTRLEGDDGTANALNITGDYKQVGDMDITGSGKISGDWTIGGTMKSGYATWSGSIVATTKLFDIEHPVDGEGTRLAHACLEGPENGVYCRGRLKREKEIYLPKYWKGLVHTNSITVQLQPVGAHQDIIIKRWDDEKVYLQAKGGMPIDCFYHVYAERKDTPALTVEYKGEQGDAPEGDIYPNIITT